MKGVKKHDKIVLLTKTKLKSIKALISRALIDAYISENGYFLVNNMLREYGNMKEAINKIKNFNSSSKILIYLKIGKIKTQRLQRQIKEI